MNSYKLHVRVLVLDEVPGSGGIPNVQRHNASHILIGIQKNGGIPMLKVKQVTVSLENQPGRLAAVASVLADAKVNIEAVLGSTAGAQGSVQLVVDNVAKAKKALSAAQFIYTEGTLEHVELPNKAGALADFATKLAKTGVNIDAAYGTVPKGARKSVLFLATSKPTAK